MLRVGLLRPKAKGINAVTMRWLKSIIITFIALQMLFAPEVCLMLCCTRPPSPPTKPICPRVIAASKLRQASLLTLSLRPALIRTMKSPVLGNARMTKQKLKRLSRWQFSVTADSR